MPFPRLSAPQEMQINSSSIWIQDTGTIFQDNKHETTSASKI